MKSEHNMISQMVNRMAKEGTLTEKQASSVSENVQQM